MKFVALLCIVAVMAAVTHAAPTTTEAATESTTSRWSALLHSIKKHGIAAYNTAKDMLKTAAKKTGEAVQAVKEKYVKHLQKAERDDQD